MARSNLRFLLVRSLPVLLTVAAGCTAPADTAKGSDTGTDTQRDTDTADADTAVPVDEDHDGRASIASGGDDCNDNNYQIYPDAPETCNGVDDDCDGLADEVFDVDGDGEFNMIDCAAGTDCNDNDPTIGATATDVPYDGIDQDCSGEDLTDVDGDSYHGGTSNDCNDNDATVNPGAAEVCSDGVDNNCDGADATCPPEVCDDGIDNDEDDLIDCDDSDCPADAACSGTNYTATSGGTMIYITAGAFPMGGGPSDSRGWYTDHHVTLTHNFYIGQTEVTEDEYLSDPDNSTWRHSSFACTGTSGDCPVDNISWYYAAMYANWLSDEEGLDDCYLSDGTDLAAAYVADPYSCNGYRLPTEAEWEYAARAGEDTEYSGSDTSTDVAWTYENAYSLGTYSHEVCALAANGWGLCDMSGNEWELVNDWLGVTDGYGDGLPDTDPIGPSAGSYRVIRGASWYQNGYYATVSTRGYHAPERASPDVGFRLARSMP